MAMTDVSVVIPLYNHEDYIADALKSVYQQSLAPHEVIIIDDGSTDRSLEAVRSSAAGHQATSVISHQNKGAHNAINEGIQLATGKYIAILNSDDVFHEQRLRRCIDLLNESDDVDAVFSEIEFIDKKGRTIANEWYEDACDYYKKAKDLGLALLNGNIIMTTSNLVIKRSVFSEIGMFSSFRYAHDLDFFLRLIANGKKIAFINEKLVKYRIHGKNTIKESVLKVKVEWAASLAFYVCSIWKKNKEWAYYSAIDDIEQRHSLSKLVNILIAFYQSLPPDKLAADAYVDNDALCRYLLSEAK